MNFETRVEKKEKYYIFPSGDLDILSSPGLQEEVLNLYREEPKDIVMDFEDLNYLDSTGLGVLIAIYKELTEDGHEICIRNAKPNIRKLFFITDLDKAFGIEE